MEVCQLEMSEEENCLCHQGTVNMRQRGSEILENRETADDDSINRNTILVNVGPQFEELSLKNLNNFLKGNKKEWEAIQHFYCIPNFNKRNDFREQKNRKKWEDILTKVSDEHPEISEKDLEKKAIEEMMREEDKQFSNYLSEQAEVKLQEIISEGMKGRPGLLIRSFQSEEHLYKELSSLLGISLVGNCSQSHSHEKECYRMESDLLLLYPDRGRLAIRLIEVKRPNSVPWAKHEKKPVNSGLVNSAQEQLVRALTFILAFLPDVPTTELDIKVVMAFPESQRSSVFCQQCDSLIISEEDISRGQSQVLKKLWIEPESATATDDSKHLFEKACARLIGKESLLHVGYRTLADKFDRSRDSETSNQNRMEKELIILSEGQREVFQNVEKKEYIKHFFFVGGSGTGKTQMALLTVDRLIQRYRRREEGRSVHVYMVHMHTSSCSGEASALQTEFEKFKNNKNNRHVTVVVASLDDLVSNEGLEITQEENVLENLCRRLEEKHAGNPVVFFLDENDIGQAQDLTSKVYLKKLTDFHFITAFSPIAEHFVRLKDTGFDFNEMDICIKDKDCLWVNLFLRYRNTSAIQNFCRFVGRSLRIYSVSIPKEVSASTVGGEPPLWIDAAEDQLMEALKFCKDQTLNDRRSDLVLLYDSTLPQHIKGKLTQLMKPRNEGGFGWKKILTWESFVGAECDTVVYVGSGNLEALSRAKLKLMMITISSSHSVSNYWRFNNVLKCAEEKCLLKRIILDEILAREKGITDFIFVYDIINFPMDEFNDKLEESKVKGMSEEQYTIARDIRRRGKNKTRADTRVDDLKRDVEAVRQEKIRELEKKVQELEFRLQQQPETLLSS